MLSERLKELRVKKGLPQNEAAKDIGVSQAAYCFFENGLKVPSVGVLCRIADYYDVSLDYICEREDRVKQESKE